MTSSFICFYLTLLLQIEWAWNYLSSLRDNQYHITRTLQRESLNSMLSRLSNGHSLTDDDRTLSRHERSHNRTSQSPSLNGEAKYQNPSRAFVPAAEDVTPLAVEESPNSSGVPSRRSHGLPTETSGVSPRPRPRERVSVPGTHTNIDADSEKELNDEENMASLARGTASLGTSEEQGSLRSLDVGGRRSRQDDADDTFNTFASLPVSRAQGDLAQHASSSQRTDPQLSTGSRSRDLSKTLFSKAEMDHAEAAHRLEREIRSLTLQTAALQKDSDHTAMGHYGSLQYRKMDERTDTSDEEMRGAYGGHRAYSSLQYTHGALAKTSDIHQFALMSNVSIELSRRSFDISRRLKLKVC